MASVIEPLVELRDVRKSFDQKAVLRGVSFALQKGTTLAVMGGSGSGQIGRASCRERVYGPV